MEKAYLTQPPRREEFDRDPSSAYCTIELPCTEEEFVRIGGKPRFAIRSTAKDEYLKHGGCTKIDGGWNATKCFLELDSRRVKDALHVILSAPYMNCLSSYSSYELEIECTDGAPLRTSFVAESVWHTPMPDEPVLDRPEPIIVFGGGNPVEPESPKDDSELSSETGQHFPGEAEADAFQPDVLLEESEADDVPAEEPPADQADEDGGSAVPDRRGDGKLRRRIIFLLAAAGVLLLLVALVFSMLNRDTEALRPDSDRVEDFISSPERSAEGAMKLFRELKKESKEDKEAAFRLLYFAAEKEDYPEAWLPYAEFRDPGNPSGLPQLKNAKKATEFYEKAQGLKNLENTAK